MKVQSEMEKKGEPKQKSNFSDSSTVILKAKAKDTKSVIILLCIVTTFSWKIERNMLVLCVLVHDLIVSHYLSFTEELHRGKLTDLLKTFCCCCTFHCFTRNSSMGNWGQLLIAAVIHRIDTRLVPVSAFWRLILCLSIVYELTMVFLLFQVCSPFSLNSFLSLFVCVYVCVWGLQKEKGTRLISLFLLPASHIQLTQDKLN